MSSKLSKKLVGIPVIGSCDANLMVGKTIMRPGHFDFWHMAGNAICLRNLTHLCGRLAARVTSLALCVVVRILAVEFLVRIVAANATDALIVYIKTFAVGQPVRLKTNIADAK